MSLAATVVDLSPVQGPPDFAYAVVKQRFAIENGRLTEVEAPDLFLDLREDPSALLPGSDFRLTKRAVDVAVEGFGYPARARHREGEVCIAVGNTLLRFLVCGPRVASVGPDGRVDITAPEPFEAVPLNFENAYGGVDMRVPLADFPTGTGEAAEEVALQADHPGLYPRNPYGKGYLVMDGPVTDVAMPCFERADMRLHAGNLLAGNPRNWFRQPIPAQVCWSYPHTFPRYAWWGMDAWYAPPDSRQLSEVSRGWLPEGFRTLIPQDPVKAMLADTAPRFMQEAASELVFESLSPATPVRIEGMLPEAEPMTFYLPERPSIEFRVGERVETVAPRLTHVVLRPTERVVDITYNASVDGVPRRFVPGMSRHIPLSVRVQGGTPVHYQTPESVSERLKSLRS